MAPLLSRGLPTALSLLPTACVLGQAELSVFTTTGRGAATTFVTDYQAVGVDPANLGRPDRYRDKHIAFGLAEGAFSVHAGALTKAELREHFLRADRLFAHDEKMDAARRIADAPFALNVDLMLAGVSYRSDALGGFGFLVRDHAQWTSTFSPLAAELLFLGSSAAYFDQVVLSNGDTIPNNGDLPETTIARIVAGLSTDPQRFSSLLDGTHIAMEWHREFNLSYGRAIAHTDAVDLYAGAGVKYLLGIGIVDVAAEGGGFTAFSSLSPYFDVDYGTAGMGSTTRVTGRDAVLPKAVGRGFGIDLGLSATVHQRVKLGVAVTDLGAITWTGNVYTANDAFLTDLTTDGLENYDVFHGIDDFVSDSGIITWQGERRRTVALPSTLRVGASYRLGELAEVGVDVVAPLNDAPGNPEKALLAIGGDIRPLPWLQVSAGIATGGGYDTRVPVGIVLDPFRGTWEFGVATRDAITFFSDTDPTLSLCAGFLRFRI